MSIPRFVFLLLAMLLVGPAHAQLAVDTLLTIGDDETAEVEYLFGSISGVVRADGGRLFVSDFSTYNVRVFDSSGTFLRRLGERGEGPGEFERPRVFTLTGDKELLVHDGRQARVTVFDTDTYDIKEVLPFGYYRQTPPEFSQGDWGGIPRLYHGPDDTFVLMLLSAGGGVPEVEEGSGHIFASLTSDLSRVVGRFGSHELLDFPDEFSRGFTSLNLEYAVAHSNGTIWYAPGPYDGEISIFEQAEGAWQHARQVEGMRVSGATHVLVDPDTENEDDLLHWNVSLTRAEGPTTFRARVLRSSAGMVERTDGDVLHFSYHEASHTPDGGELVVERFSPEGLLVGVYSIADGLPLYGSAITVHDIDEDGNLYTIDRTGDAAVIRVLSVVWSE
jgi:hypothetical protein